MMKYFKIIAIIGASVGLLIAYQNFSADRFECTVHRNQCVYSEISKRNTINILIESNTPNSPFTPDTTTHMLTSGAVVLGISKYGGGYINYLKLPGIGDILGPVSARFGRGGQSAIRDELHGRKYNPTQAGFTDTAGVEVNIIEGDGKLTIPPFNLPAFNGDGEYDFAENSNLARDKYKTPGDWDLLTEEPGNQDQEVRTEFDYWGEYKNCLGGVVSIPCFKHQYQYRFVRTLEESHFLKQFLNPEAKKKDGTPILKEEYLNNGFGKIDLAAVISGWSLRFDNSIWDPKFRFYLTTDGRLVESSREKIGTMADPRLNNYEEVIIVASSNDVRSGIALGFYRPGSRANINNIVTRTFDGRNIKSENRTTQNYMSDNRTRLDAPNDPSEDMSLIYFRNNISGLRNPGRPFLLGSDPSSLKDRQYEMIRNEVYILVGTPEQIRKNILAIRDLANAAP